MNSQSITRISTAHLYDAHVLKNYGQAAATLVRGRGAQVWDDEGNAYLDFTSGIAVSALGHCHPHWVAAIQQQAGELIHTSNLFRNPNQGELARRLVGYAGPGRVFFCNSGGEADEALIKSLGADIVVRRGDDVATRIREHFPDGVDGLADGAVLKELAIPALRDGGSFTSVRGYDGDGQRGINFSKTFVREYDGETEKLDSLRQLVEAGAITLRVADTFKPEDAPAAHRRLEAGGTRGRLVIEF